MRKRRKIKVESVPVFAFVVDGETEVWYLQMLKRNEQNSRNVQVRIKPEIPQKKSVKEQYNLAISLSEREFTQVIWILDLDTIIKESKETQKGKKTALQLFDEYRKECEKKYPNIIIITINPCLEFWFLLHFLKTAKSFEKCSEAIAQLKKYLPDYQKSQNYFIKHNDDIYLKLKPRINTAITNSLELGKYDSQNPNKAICEMYLLFQSLSIELSPNFLT